MLLEAHGELVPGKGGYSDKVSGVPRSKGAYVIRAGSTHTLVVKSATRPTCLVASTTGKPGRAEGKFSKVGKNRWALPVHFDSSMREASKWVIGVKVGKKVVTVPIRITS